VTKTIETESRDMMRKGWASEEEGWSRRRQRRNGGVRVCLGEEADVRVGGEMRSSFLFRSAGFIMKSQCCYAMVDMIFGEVSGRAEDQTPCIFCKQHDIFCVVPHLCGPRAKSSD
jgi:hypothetical protein